MQNKNDKILAPIKNRLLQVIDLKVNNKKKFFLDNKISSSNFRGNALFSEVSAEIVAKILSIFQDVSSEWILFGKGNMLKGESSTKELHKDRQKEIDRLLELLDQKDREIDELKKEQQYYRNIGIVAEKPASFQLKKPKN